MDRELAGEGFRYIVAGIVNVFVTWICYSLLAVAGVDINVSNILSWVIGVLVAFAFNKWYVFHVVTGKPVFTEFYQFIGSRIVTGVIAWVLFPVLVFIGLGFVFLGVEGLFAKILVTVIEIALNFVFAKLFVFKKGGTTA